MRHLAWLHAVPEGSKTRKSRLEKAREQGGDDHPDLVFPDVDTEYSAGYLIEYLQEAGLMSSNGMGPVSLSWQEIDAWCNRTGAEPSTWELLTIKTLSETYVSELAKASARDYPRPYTPVVQEEEVDREAISNKVYSFLSGLKAKRDN